MGVFGVFEEIGTSVASKLGRVGARFEEIGARGVSRVGRSAIPIGVGAGAAYGIGTFGAGLGTAAQHGGLAGILTGFGDPQGGGGSSGSGGSFILPVIIIGAVIVILVMLPKRRR